MTLSKIVSEHKRVGKPGTRASRLRFPGKARKQRPLVDFLGNCALAEISDLGGKLDEL